MKRVTSITLLALLSLMVFTVSACTSGTQHQNHENHADHMAEDGHMDHGTHMEESGNMATASMDMDIPKEKAQQILTAYLKIKNELVQTDGTAASQAAAELVATLGGEAGELLEKIRFDAGHIAETEDPTHQRDHFNSLSDNVYSMLKATEANQSPIYRQYCPMAFDGKGAFWLAAEKEVNNPYFGDMMLHCGKVEEEL